MYPVSVRIVLAGVGGIFALLLLASGLSQSDKWPIGLEHIQTTIPNHNGDGSLQNVHNATLGFERIFVLNLPSRTDHRDALSLAAHYTGLQLTYVDGVTDVSRKTLPPGGEKMDRKGVLGSCRAHMNVLRAMIEDNITSALVFKDDIDWDVRIKSQMEDFARDSRLLVQPVPSTSDQCLDPAYSSTGEEAGSNDFDIMKEATVDPMSSPYGDIQRWDLLWLGHCGARFPKPGESIPLGRAVIFDDETVPEKQHIDAQYGDTQLVQQYPHHTRVVSRARMNTCTLAYAISLPAARRFLYELAIRKMDRATEIMMRDMCDGTADRSQQICLSVQPQLFQHHPPVASKLNFTDIGKNSGDYSDVGRQEADYSDIAFTRNIRWSTRVNFPQLGRGEQNYTDLFRDGEPRPDLHFP